MQLGTFGAILKYAIEIEGSASSFYDQLAKVAPEAAKANISEMANASRRNKQTLEKTRRMEMQEMILEAITGIDTSNYDVKLEAASAFEAGVAQAQEMERRASAFYADASKKLGFLPNAGRTMEKTGKERAARIEKIKA